MRDTRALLMKVTWFLLRLIGALFFILAAVGYYRQELVVTGLIAAAIGGLCAAPSEKYPGGIRTKTALIIVGTIIVIVLTPPL